MKHYHLTDGYTRKYIAKSTRLSDIIAIAKNRKENGDAYYIGCRTHLVGRHYRDDYVTDEMLDGMAVAWKPEGEVI